MSDESINKNSLSKEAITMLNAQAQERYSATSLKIEKFLQKKINMVYTANELLAIRIPTIPESSQIYKLYNKVPVPISFEESLGSDSPWLNSNRRVADTRLRIPEYRKAKKGGYRKTSKTCSVRISTVFLVIAHYGFRSEEPLLFETMVFFKGRTGKRSPFEGHMSRYKTWESAKAGHEYICKQIVKLHQKR